ncbi:plastocyanin/azurin family copper-binding protein [Halorussus pelagicus]|uniref:plastocyanin/azurin family copper-binding protein n=1 Tax=Halorussus pelagicus TaxID=2505977 RepID=UPI001FB69D89|nr:plastocyanin/azurin family copper-binding protein [Halorussus pelagicus]
MAATGVAGGGAAGATAAAAQETTTTSSGNTTASENETTTAANATTTSGGSSGGGGPTEEVIVGPGGSLVYEPADLTIAPGTTVNFVWESDNHNIVVNSQPDGAGWEGTAGSETKTYNTGHEHSHTFETTGTYEYYCQPHRTAGMKASITVQEGGAQSSGGGGHAEEDPKHMGVPIQAHFVGLGALLMMAVSLVYTFFILKYGESPHASGGN